MIATIAIAYGLEDRDETALTAVRQFSADIDVAVAVDAFQGENMVDITDAAIEEYITEAVLSDSLERTNPVVDTDDMTNAVAALRAAIERERAT